MNHDPDGSSQELDQDGQPKHAEDGPEDGSLVTRESAFLEGGGAGGGGGGNTEVQYYSIVCFVVDLFVWYLFIFLQLPGILCAPLSP